MAALFNPSDKAFKIEKLFITNIYGTKEIFYIKSVDGQGNSKYITCKDTYEEAVKFIENEAHK